MDYKEIIEAMRNTDIRVILSYSTDAANAIETLLAERDAAMRDLKGNCAFCIHKKLCMFGNHMRDICVNGSSWQWRGPQKHD